MPKLPVATCTHNCTGDYEGIAAVLWLNPPGRIKTELASGDAERAAAAAGQLIRSWNLEREDGEPWPVPANGAGWDELPEELAGELLTAWGKAMEARAALPKASATPSSNTSTTDT